MQKTIFLLSLLIVIFFSACENNHQNTTIMKPNRDFLLPSGFDWQGHRGARGLLPENTIPAFIKAIELGVPTLELDVVASKDDQIIVSHEAWFSHHICTKPDGTPVTEEEAETLLLLEMTYEEIKQYDCGIRGNERFEEQQPMKVHKPSLMDMVTNVEIYCQKNKKPKPFYNIEIKSQPDYYDKRVPQPAKFVQLILDELDLLNAKERVTLQSFDINILNEIHKQDSSVVTAQLVENTESVAENLAKINFTPDKYSPYYMLLNEEVIKDLHQRGILVVPWTVNDPEVMVKLREIGVDGIITDYPNLIPKI